MSFSAFACCSPSCCLLHVQDGYSPLHNASQEGYDGIVEKLLQAGATVDLQTKVGIAVPVWEGVRSQCNEPSNYDRVHIHTTVSDQRVAVTPVLH